MNRTLRAIVAVLFIGVIMFCAIVIFQGVGKKFRADITDQKLYTLSDGTKSILARVQQPITMKLYYSRTAAMKGPDQIRFYNNYYFFVKALLDEYASASNGKVNLQVIDPRPFSDEESQAMRNGIKKFPLSEDENFFFGLVVQTPFGVSKSIPFFSPDRQNFVEYDISYLIDTAIARQKKRIGVLSSLPVMGDDVSGYMAQMMAMQGQQPKPGWTIIEQLKDQYEFSRVAVDAQEIKDIDMLLVIHPKDLVEQTQFAIDQYVLKGGRTIVMVDPFCVSDRPARSQMQNMQQPPSSGSDIPSLLKTWGLEMPANTFAADRDLAIAASMTANQNPQKIISFLDLNAKCFNVNSIICSKLNQVRILFAGQLKLLHDDPNSKLQYTQLIKTTNRGNTFTVSSPYELMMPDADRMMSKFTEGTEPVSMGYMVTGRFKSAFPNGIEVAVDANLPENQVADANAHKPLKKHLAGLTQASADCAVIIFSDVDMITDMLAFQKSFFGATVVGDNSALLLNAIDNLSGSTDLITIRSRGNFQRPFEVVDKIESEAEKATAQQEAAINAQIQGFQQELNKLVANSKEGDEQLLGNSILAKKKEIELKIHEAQGKLREVKAKKREKIEQLGNDLRNLNMAAAPAAILLVAIGLGIRRSVRRRHYISHKSDA